jgi:lipopolysaccharide transport system permease protein
MTAIQASELDTQMNPPDGPIQDIQTTPSSVQAAHNPIADGGLRPKTTSRLPRVRIEPSTGWVSLKIKELWEYRELLYFLTWRDIKVRYKQTTLGAAWAIIQPFLTMVVFSLFFGRLANVPSDGLPYPIFSYAALVPWTFFAQGMTQSTLSLVNSSNLLKKVYFPRLVIPISSVLAGVVDFILAFIVLLGMMIYFGINPFTVQIPFPLFTHSSLPIGPVIYVANFNFLWLSYFFLLAFVTSLGVGLWLSAMNVQFRDIRYVVPFLVQIWMFITPIAYPSSLLGEPWRTLYGINPMAGVVEGFRWALLGTNTAPGPIIIVSSVVAILLLVTGAFYFRRMEKTFADVV